MRRRGVEALVLLLVCLGIGATSMLAPPPIDHTPVRTVTVPTPPPPVTLSDTLRSGQTLGEVFGTYGLDGGQIEYLVDLVRRFQNPRRLRPGTVVHFAMRAAEPPSGIAVQLDADRVLYLLPDRDGGEWDVRLDSVPVVRDTVVLGGRVGSNLYTARLFGEVDRLAPGEHEELVLRLAEIFAWQLDFYRDVQRGDEYRVAIERDVRPDGSVRSARLVAAEYEAGDRTLRAIRFTPTGDERGDYFEADGAALRSQFLRAPLEFARVTSRFNLRRYHPILKRRRPHLGTDYGARPGTPVRATGGGVVTRAGWWGGYGRMVEIRHANGMRTRYAHLRGVASGVRPGIRVEQGRTLGYVGSTGLATAPHLHYEFLQNGRQVNPARLDLPRAEPVSAEDRVRFERERDEALALLARLDGTDGSWAAGDGEGRDLPLAGATDD